VRYPLLRGLAQSLLIGAILTGPAFAQVNVTVDATKAVRTVDSRAIGVNTACWDWSFDTTATGPLLAAANIGVLRYPGGGTADVYFWTNNQVQNTDANNNPIAGSFSTMGTDFDQFAVVALTQGSQAFITVNYGTSTPTDAANWVKYSNITKGYGFKYWEVGNENYGTWETDANTKKNDPVVYATRFVQYYNAMKAIDPAIEVGAVATTSTEGSYTYPSEAVSDPATGQSHSEWNYIILSTMKGLGVMPDFLICHRYEQNSGQENDATLLQLASTPATGWQVDAALLRTPLNDFYEAKASGVELCCTENNSVHNNPGKQIVSLVNGLYLADSLGSLLQTEFNSRVWWAFRNGPNTTGNNNSTLYGWLTTFGDYGIVATNPSPAPAGYPAINTPFPTFYAFKLLSNFAAGGDTVVTAASDNIMVSAYAVQRANGSLSILVINKSPTSTYTVSFALTGFTPLASAATYSYGMPQDNAAKTGTGSPDVATGGISNAAASFGESVAPYSMTVFSLSPPIQVRSQPSSQTIASGSTVTFSFSTSGTPAPSYQWYLNDAPIASATNSTLVVSGATAADAGSYTCIASNSAEQVTSSAATLTVSAASTPSRLTNISCRAQAGTGGSIIIAGFVVGGLGTSGDLSVLIRGTGPTLGQSPYKVPAVLPDPQLELYKGNPDGTSTLQQTVGAWGGNALIASTAASVGAFSWPLASLDSAILASLPESGYTAQVAGKSGDTGVALVEAYDATPAGTYTLASPRLTNLSARVQVGTGANVVFAGFVIAGPTAKTVLIRASGPTLGMAFSVPGTLPDPKLTLTNVTTKPNFVVASNTVWGGDPQIAAIASQVGAFSWGPSSLDSAILITLPPGNYTAGVAGASGDTGIALVEVYEVQ
jgi:hypothetical protein